MWPYHIVKEVQFLLLCCGGGREVEMAQESFIYLAMKRLLEEQEMISFTDVKFRFVSEQIKKDTIPFSFVPNEKNESFTAYFKNITTKYFRLEKLDEINGLAELSLLEAIDMEGNTVDPFDDFYALRKTKGTIIINVNRFQDIHPLPPKLVNRKLPVIEPKY